MSLGKNTAKLYLSCRPGLLVWTYEKVKFYSRTVHTLGPGSPLSPARPSWPSCPRDPGNPGGPSVPLPPFCPGKRRQKACERSHIGREIKERKGLNSGSWCFTPWGLIKLPGWLGCPTSVKPLQKQREEWQLHKLLALFIWEILLFLFYQRGDLRRDVIQTRCLSDSAWDLLSLAVVDGRVDRLLP